MQKYLDLLRHVREEGHMQENRTGINTCGLFGAQLQFDLAEGFPVVTTKEIHIKSVIHELLWIISGSTNVGYLQENGVRIWDEWADERGELGPVYGQQWRSWPTWDRNSGPDYIDQLQQAITRIRENPTCRRNIVTAWNPGLVDQMALPPCHCFFQFHVNVKLNELSLHMYQRSADMFLGVPFNITSYALLLKMVADVTGLKARHFIHSFGDIHIYENHFEQVDLQLSREPRKLPTMNIEHQDNIDDFKYEHFELSGYDPHPKIKAQVAV